MDGAATAALGISLCGRRTGTARSKGAVAALQVCLGWFRWAATAVAVVAAAATELQLAAAPLQQQQQPRVAQPNQAAARG